MLRSKRDTVALDLVCKDKIGVLAHVSTIIASAGFNIDSVELRRDVDEGLVGIHFILDATADMGPLLAQLSEQEVVISILPVRVSGNRGTRRAAREKRKG